jgi:hypothetical protein
VPNTLCVCGHEREAHEHYRRGTDCATCGAEVCPKFRRALVRKNPSSPSTGPTQRAGAETRADSSRS